MWKLHRDKEVRMGKLFSASWAHGCAYASNNI
jgi:hypothetical protein